MGWGGVLGNEQFKDNDFWECCLHFQLPVFLSTKPKKSPDNDITRSPTHTRESCRRRADSIVMESPHHPVENVNFMLYYSSAEFERQSALQTVRVHAWKLFL